MKRLLLAVFLGSVCGVGVASADPPKPDPRLERTVTVEAVAAPLEDVLADLSRQTGVSLALHHNLKNQKVTVLVDEQPLYLVMNSVRDLLDGLWFTKEVGGETGYSLQQKHGWQQYAARLRAERRAETERREAEFRSHIREAARVASLPGEALLSMLDTNPEAAVEALLYRWGETGGPGGLLAELSEAQLEMVFEGEYISIPYGNLSPDGQAAIEQYMSHFRQDMREQGGQHPLLDTDTALLYLHVYRVEPFLLDDPATSTPEHIEVWLTRSRRGGLGLQLGSLGHPSAWNPRFHRLRGLADVVDLTEAELRKRLEGSEAGRAFLACFEPTPGGAATRPEGTSEQPHAEEELLDLELGKDQGLMAGETRAWPFETVLEAVHRKGGLQVVADSYALPQGSGLWGTDRATTVPKEPSAMAGKVAEAFGRGWACDGDIHRFRSLTWFEADFLEPPVWLIKRLEGKVDREKQSSDFSFEDFVTAARYLRDEQIEALAKAQFPNPHYMGISLMSGLHRRRADVLRWYASLDAVQQQRLRGDGIGMADLDPTQQAAFAACLNRAFTTELPLPQIAAATVRLTVEARETEREPGEKWISSDVVFTFSLSGGKQERVNFWLGAKPVASEEQEPAH